MRGSIRRRGKRSWELRFDQLRGADGARRQRHVSFQGTRKQAEQELTRLVREAQTGSVVDPSRVTLGEFLIDHWFRVHRQRIAPSRPGIVLN